MKLRLSLIYHLPLVCSNGPWRTTRGKGVHDGDDEDLFFCFVAVLVSATSFAETGILLLSHGGSAEWNGRVLELARTVDQTRPVEVAFGMATRANIQAAVDRLAARGVTEIVAVPLFVSSWSSVVTSTEYLLGLRAEAPAGAGRVREDGAPRSRGVSSGRFTRGPRGRAARAWGDAGRLEDPDQAHDTGAERASARGRDPDHSRTIDQPQSGRGGRGDRRARADVRRGEQPLASGHGRARRSDGPHRRNSRRSTT